MIKELLNFTESIDPFILDNPKRVTKGLHLFIDRHENGELYVSKTIDTTGDIDLEIIKQAFLYEESSSYLSMNKQQKFDKNQKIHSANPFCFAFNFSLGSKKSEVEENLKKKIAKGELSKSLKIESKNFKIEEVKKSIDSYFINAKRLCLGKTERYDSVLEKFKTFCKEKLFDIVKFEKGNTDNYSTFYEDSSEKTYVKAYLVCIPIEEWKTAYQYYFESEYPQDNVVLNDFFCATYNQKKPFLLHHTASFDTNFKFKGPEATVIKKFEGLAKSKNLPKPLPIFIYKEELNKKIISIFKEYGEIKYREIIEKLYEFYEEDLDNYYLLNWFYGKEFRVIDFDFVSRFEYRFRDPLIIQNLFEIREKGGKEEKRYSLIKNIFDFEQQVFNPLIQNKYHRVDYFSDLDKKDYDKLDMTFSSYSKYRKAVYDFIYKSQRNVINGNVFYEMSFNGILDDIKNYNEYGIKEKLNIWYSLYEYFNPKQKINMVNRLKEYQDFVSSIIAEKPLTDITDECFAFAAGQVIEYILSKSKSADNSFNLLEPYLQQSKCAEFKKAIANDFGRYKHENFSKNFEKVAAFVLSYDTDTNLKHLLPQILSGVFAKNQLFSSNSSN